MASLTLINPLPFIFSQEWCKMSVEADLVRALQGRNAELTDENQDLKVELRRLRGAIRALKKMQDALRTITEETDVFALVNQILFRALEAVDSENGSLLLIDEDTDELVFVEVHGPYRDSLKGYRLSVDEGIAGWVVRTRNPKLVPDVHLEPLFSPMVDHHIGFRTTSLVCVPLVYQDKAWGVIEVVNTRSGDPFREGDMEIMLLFARLAAQAIARAERAVTESEGDSA
jgi:GAF domain-containing protein